MLCAHRRPVAMDQVDQMAAGLEPSSVEAMTMTNSRS